MVAYLSVHTMGCAEQANMPNSRYAPAMRRHKTLPEEMQQPEYNTADKLLLEQFNKVAIKTSAGCSAI